MDLQQTLYVKRDDGFDRERYSIVLKEDTSDIRLLFVCTGSPQQECWTQYHIQQLEHLGVCACNAGGLIDFRS